MSPSATILLTHAEHASTKTSELACVVRASTKSVLDRRYRNEISVSGDFRNGSDRGETYKEYSILCNKASYIGMHSQGS